MEAAVTVHWNEGADTGKHTSLRLRLPRKWLNHTATPQPAARLIKDFFVASLLKKHPDLAATLEGKSGEFHLERVDGGAVSDGDVIPFLLLQASDSVTLADLEAGKAKFEDLDLFLKPGEAPKEATCEIPNSSAKAKAKTGPAAAKANLDSPVKVTTAKTSAASSSAPKPVTKESDEDKNYHVASAQAIEAAKQPKRLDFDYTKWDRLDLSDDDDADCHPNIDKASWKRLKGQMRKERREKEDETLTKLKGKVEKHSKRAGDLEEKLRNDSGNANLKAELEEARKTAEKYQGKLDHFLAHRKLIADDLCETKEDVTKVVSAPLTEPKITLPANEERAYDVFVRKYKHILTEYSKIRRDEDSEEYIGAHPELLDEHADGYLLLLCLHTAMTHLKEGEKTASKRASNERIEMAVARQHMFIQYILELSKSMKVDPRAAVRPFFLKTSKQSPEHLKGFEDDLRAFVLRIRNRAQEKMDKGEPSPLADDGGIRATTKGDASSSANTAEGSEDMDEDVDGRQFERAPAGPGGLDPTEVLQSLPKDLQQAFIDQDTEKLKRVMSELPPEEANYHLQRCIDSGLWVANANNSGGEGEGEDDEE